jgi:hypothetical protein
MSSPERSPGVLVLLLACETGSGYRALLGGRRNPLDQPAGEVDCHERATLIGGEDTLGGRFVELLYSAPKSAGPT